MDPTAELLASMLRENTGRALCDSGDFFGRHYGRNKLVDFEKLRPTAWSFAGGSLTFAHHVYHWLKERLTFNIEIQEKFELFVEGRDDEFWLPVMEEFVSTIKGAAGLNGEGAPFVRNTYNGEDCLSQTLQYLYWTDDEGEHVLLQIHNGADIRGGYTAPNVFDLDDYSIMDNAKAYMHCEECEASWSTDNAYTWCKDDGTEKDFDDYPMRVDGEEDERVLREGDLVRLLPATAEDLEGWQPTDLMTEPGNYTLLENVSGDKQTTFIPVLASSESGKVGVIYANKIAEVVTQVPRLGGAGTVVIENRKGYCPECGEGELQISA